MTYKKCKKVFFNEKFTIKIFQIQLATNFPMKMGGAESSRVFTKVLLNILFCILSSYNFLSE